MRHFTRKNIGEFLLNTHKQAKIGCLNSVTSDLVVSPNWMLSEYRKWFIVGLLESSTKSSQDTAESWTFKELERELIAAGIPDEAIDVDDESYLIIDAYHDMLQLNYDSFGRTFLYHGFEYEAGRWDLGTVKLIKLIYDNISSDSYLKPYVDDCLKECMHEQIRQKIIETAGIGILMEKFNKDDNFRIIGAYSHKDKFSCKINTSWGTITFKETLPDLPCVIDSIIHAKEQFQLMMEEMDRE